MKSAGELKELYRAQMIDGGDKINVTAAPGRVVFLGEHLAPVNGITLSAAVDGYVYSAAQRRADREVNIYSALFDERITFSLNSMSFDSEDGWANFPKSVLYYLERSGAKLPGFNMVVDSDLPDDAGLASSTSFCAATAYFCYMLGRAELEGERLFRLVNTAERKFLKQPAQLVDALTIGMCEEGKLMCFDHADKSTRMVKAPENVSLVVARSGARPPKNEDVLQERAEEAEEGLQKFARFLPEAKTLRELSYEGVKKKQLKVPVKYARACRHISGENYRVEEAVKALEADDPESFGKLLSESHASLSKDYRLSTPELDLIVELAAGCPGFMGGRMFGLGMGGSTVNVVREEKCDEFMTRLRESFRSKRNEKLVVFPFKISGGVREMKE